MFPTARRDLLERAHQGAVLVTASRRLARTLNQSYKQWRRAEGDTVWPTPAILPWSAWLEKLWDTRLFGQHHVPIQQQAALEILLSRSQERVVWQKIIECSVAGDPLLDIPATAEAAANSWQLLKSWDLERRALEAEAGDDTAVFLSWADEFQRVCAAEGWVEQASLPDRLASALHSLALPPLLLLSGFDEVSPQQQRFLDACRAAGTQVEIADPADSQAPSSAVCVAFQDSNDEIRAAARWARGLLDSGVSGPIGVVIQALDQMREKVERIFTETLHPAAVLPGRQQRERAFNISVGQPLTAYPIIRTALLILDLDLAGNHFTHLGALLRSRYLSGGEAEWTRRGALDAEIREQGATDLTIERLRGIARSRNVNCPRFLRALGKWRSVRISLPQKQRASGWSRAFSLLLDAFGWPGDRPLDSREYQIAQEWNATLSELARLDTVLPAAGAGEALRELKRIAAGTIFQPEGGNSPIQILGILEASGLRFEHLWIAGLHDETWPGPAAPDPFLPVPLQRRLQMPHASPERELEFARLITNGLLGSTNNIIVSFPAHEGDRDLGPSPLISDIPHIPPKRLHLRDYPLYNAIIRETARIETVEDAQAPIVEAESWQKGGIHVFEFQAACPFRAFAELRLSAVALECPKPGLNERERGLLIHYALENVWRNLKSQERLATIRSEILTQVIHDAVASAIRSLAEDRGSELAPNFAAIEQSRLESLLRNWLELEKHRAPFEVIQPEGERYAELGGIRFKVRIDRIDRLPDGREVIVDYKTGRPKLSDWEGPRPENPQLPLYAATHPDELAGILFGQIRAGDMRVIGVGDSQAIEHNIKQVNLPVSLDAWRSVLMRLGEDFRAGNAVVDPKDPVKSCRYCGLQALCRVREITHKAPVGMVEDE